MTNPQISANHNGYSRIPAERVQTAEAPHTNSTIGRKYEAWDLTAKNSIYRHGTTLSRRSALVSLDLSVFSEVVIIALSGSAIVVDVRTQPSRHWAAIGKIPPWN